MSSFYSVPYITINSDICEQVILNRAEHIVNLFSANTFVGYFCKLLLLSLLQMQLQLTTGGTYTTYYTLANPILHLHFPSLITSKTAQTK